jgi:hypothetical protein
MGRSVDYLKNAVKVNYFQYPTLWVYDEETGKDIETEEYEEWQWVIEAIQETIKSNYPDFENCRKLDGRETSIILTGYGVEIGLSEYCGLATLSVRVDENVLNYCDTDEEAEEAENTALNWIRDNWEECSKNWNEYKKIGTFSNGEGVFEKAI